MILVTAFEPFGGKTWNASNMVLDLLKIEADKILLPVSIEQSNHRIEGLDVSMYDFIIMLGEANRDYLSLEMKAYNEIDMRIPDNQGLQLKNQKIDQGHTYITPIKIDNFIKPGVVVSDDPGRYLCNYAYYQMSKKHPRVLFIHVSATKELVDVQTKLIEEIIHEIKTVSITR